MQRGGNVDACVIGVIDAQPMTLVGIPANTFGSRQAADAGHVHLHDIDAAYFHHLLKLLDIADFLTGCDPDRAVSAEPGISLEVVGVQGFFQPNEVKALELFGSTNGGGRVPTQPRIHHQFRLLAKPLTSGADLSEVAFFALPHRSPTELNRSKPLLDQLSTDALRFGRCV